MSRVEVALVASAGGHFEQLYLISKSIRSSYLYHWYSTYKSAPNSVDHELYFRLPDVSSDDSILAMFKSFKIALKACRANSYNVIVSTGALPGLIFCFAAKAMLKKTIWVDSVANVENLSLSGRLAVYFCSEVYTQWPHLQSRKVKYIGSVL